MWFPWIGRHQLDKYNTNLNCCLSSFVYLCIALFTELFNLASSDIPVLITVSAFIESQASTDATFPGSWRSDRIQPFIPAHTLLKKKKLLKSKKINASFISAELQLQLWIASTVRRGKKIKYNSLSSRRSVMSNSKEGKILLNILKSLPKRGIWMIRQEGALGRRKIKI